MLHLKHNNMERVMTSKTFIESNIHDLFLQVVAWLGVTWNWQTWTSIGKALKLMGQMKVILLAENGRKL